MKVHKLLVLLSALVIFNGGDAGAAETSETSLKETAKTESAAATTPAGKNESEEKKPTADSLKAVKWHEYLTEALKLAREKNKPVMIDAYTSWCGWCKKMDKETFSDPAVVDLSLSFICLRVNPEEDEMFSNKYTVKDFPTVIFLKPDGTELDRHVGFKTTEDFIKILKTILEKTK